MLRCKLDLINVVGQLGADLEAFFGAQPLFLYQLQFRCICVGICHSLPQYTLNLSVNTFEMSLEISLGRLNKVFIIFETFRVNGRFATAQMC